MGIKDQTKISSTQFTRDLIKDNHTIQLNQTNFNVAFRLVFVATPSGRDPPKRIDNVYRYFSLRVQQQRIKFNQVRFRVGMDPQQRNYEDRTLAPCTPETMGVDEDYFRRIEGNLYFCPTNSSFLLQGQQSSELR